ncbi:zinc knuckle-domain-containing protein [Xylogone sp. PMI_703]|nr:zinc knuckle-domain-containing protein [Xylogone sp. PMI_703]
MNRYHRGPAFGGPSKATASTLCQKCLKRGHYSYECKAVVQDRPYVPRPSRTQQLLNPKLVPKLTSDVPQDLLRKKGVADEQLAKNEKERGRKRERQNEELEAQGSHKRMRSASSGSVSTISTNRSRSRSQSKEEPEIQRRQSSFSRSPLRRSGNGDSDRYNKRYMSASRSPSISRRRSLGSSERKRRRGSRSSVDTSASEGRSQARDSRAPEDDRNIRRRYSEVSPVGRGRRTESRGPDRRRRSRSNDRRLPQSRNETGAERSFHGTAVPKAPPRQRSLSPFSKRLALTQAMNMGR